MTRFVNRSTLEVATRIRVSVSSLARRRPTPLRGLLCRGLHAGDQPLDPLVDRAEWVLAQHGALGLVVELEMHPVHGKVAPGRLRGADELTAQPGTRGLRRRVDSVFDFLVGGDAGGQTVALQQVEYAAATLD